MSDILSFTAGFHCRSTLLRLIWCIVNSIRTSWDLQALKENRRAVDNTSTSWKSFDNVAWTMSKSDLYDR